MQTKGTFALGFVAGFGTAIALAIGAVLVVAFGAGFSGPTLEVVATAPDAVHMGETFTLSIEARNPHDVAVEFDNVDVPERTLERFDITSTSRRQLGEAIGGFGSLTWFPEQVLEPGSSETVEFAVKARRPGRQVLELEVCNDFEDCTPIHRVVEVTAAVSADPRPQAPGPYSVTDIAEAGDE